MFPSRGLSPLTQPGWILPTRARGRTTIGEFCQAAPDRMLGAPWFRVYDIDHAVEEVYRTVESSMAFAPCSCVPTS